MKIDVHWHHAPRRFTEAVLSGSLKIAGQPDPAGAVPGIIVQKGRVQVTDDMTAIEPALAALDAAGLDHATPSIVPPLSQYEAPADIAISVARVVNDGFAEMKEASGGRFLPLAHVPLQHPAAAITEMRRAIGELGLAGVAIGTNIDGRNIGEEWLRPFWRAVAEDDVFVFVHPENPLGAERLQNHQLRNFVGFPVETAAAVASMIFDGTYREVGQLKTVYAHGGGAFPYIFGRWQHGYTNRIAGGSEDPGDPFSYLPSLYCDSLVHSEQSLRFLIELVGADHVMLGGDYPFNMGNSDPHGTMTQGVSDEELREAIAGGNAARLLGLDSQS
jgi:aminocarboxymuconate-semialdehyde decarboxylase